MPFTAKEKNNDKDNPMGIYIMFYLSLGVAFVPSLVSAFICKERETSMKH